MDFADLLPALIGFAGQNRVAVGLIVAGLVGYALWRPKSALRLVALLAFVGAAFYFATLFTDSLAGGVKQKDQMIRKSEKVLND